MVGAWNPELYRRFEEERTRPARELLARVPYEAPRSVWDLGCGPGNSTELLADRYPAARIVGTDNSEPMLASARHRLPAYRFEFSDIEHWAPDVPADLIFSNAALHWLGDHETLIPRLFGLLAPGGVLAIQMPDTREEPIHRLMREVAAEAPYAAFIDASAARRTEILPPAAYYDLLAPAAAEVDIWHTTYQHPLASAAKIVEWVRSTGLKPFVDPLPATEQQAYLAAYERHIAAVHPARADGRLLLAFPRVFIVARRA